ncbi:MAG: TIGR02757 family protein [bacterium]
MNKKQLKEFLDIKAIQYNTVDFIETDPIQIPHQFSKKEDIEISAYLTATIAWGNRKSIINNASKMMALFGNAPYDFILNASNKDLEELNAFVHRTFNGEDLKQFVLSLRNIYTKHHGLEGLFAKNADDNSLQRSIHEFKKVFFEIDHLPRTTKHVSDPLKNSAAKRINMFLRWMIRKDTTGVDLGIWSSLNPSQLSCPLDVHTGNIARKLKLLKRKQNDGKALYELDNALRNFDPVDPVKYDFALFGLGAFEGF